MITVLVLSSSPIDQAQLRLGTEAKLILHSLNSAQNRDQYRVISLSATTVDDLRRYMLEHSPTIVHFCGHGDAETGVLLEDDEGRTHAVSGASLAKLFHLINEEVKCVVLNACYSDEQARQISEHIDFVIGMKGTVTDPSALKFAQGFYEAVWAGQSFERAFKFGCSAIDTANLPDEQAPVILRSPRLGGLRLAYNEETQEIENFLLRYLNSSVEERTALTVEGSAILGVMRRHYAETISSRFEFVRVLATRDLDAENRVVTALVGDQWGSIQWTYYLRIKGESDLALHWRATIGHCEVPLLVLRALGSERPATIRAIASINDYFNYGYEPEQYISIKLAGVDDAGLAAFMSRQHAQCQQMIDLLSDGREHRIVLRVFMNYPGRNAAEVTDLLSDSWLILNGSDTTD